MKGPRLTAWRQPRVVRRLHPTTGRSASRDSAPTPTSRAVRTTANASCSGSASFHRRLARRYGARAFSYCDNRRTARRVVFARGARAPRLHRRQIRQRQNHLPVQSRHGRHRGRGGGCRHRPARRPGARHSRRHPALAHQRRVLSRCRRDRAPVGFNPATRIAPERRALAAAGIVVRVQASVVRQLGTAA